MMKFEEAIKKAKVELSQAIYLSECSESKGIRTINSNKADFLSSLIYLAEIGIGRNVPEIINRQQAEIERLTALCTEQNEELDRLQKVRANILKVMKENISQTKSEAIKEFAERLKEKVNLDLCEAINCSDYLYDLPKLIDNLVK